MSDEAEDYGIRLLKKLNMPITRQNYIDMAFGGAPPDPWTPEDEEALPEELQDFSVFGPEMEDAMYMDDEESNDNEEPRNNDHEDDGA